MAAASAHAGVRGPRAWHSPVAWITLLLVLSLGLTLDLWSKAWAFRTVAPQPVILNREAILTNPNGPHVPPHPSKEVIGPKILHLHLVINHGAVFGIGQQKRAFFIAFTVGAIGVGILIFARWTGARHRVAHVALGLILAGGVGNLYDRWSFAVVRDFLYLFPKRDLPFGWNWPGGSTEIFPWVFNLADVMLLTGMGLMMIHINRVESRKSRNEAETQSDTRDPVPSLEATAARGRDEPTSE